MDERVYDCASSTQAVPCPLIRMLALKLDHIGRWSRLAAATTAAQATVQFLSLVAGILIVRSLSPEEYAYFTIANATLGAMTVLSDSGIGNAMLALAGPVWQDRRKLGAVLATAISLRRYFAVPVALALLPIGWVLLRQHDASPAHALLILLS